MKNSITKRWQEAQRAELDWWQNWRRLPFYTNHSFENNWRKVLSHFLTPSEMSNAQTIIEVGTGPHGVVRYLFEDASIKIGLDPLLCRFDERPRPNKNTCYVAAVGEFLPVRDAAADLVVCINVLDHVMDAGQILGEIRRVLKPNGRLLLEIHTFPKIFTPIMFLDHPHTYHWSWSGMLQLVRDGGFEIITTRQFPFPVTIPLKSWAMPNHWKYIFGKHFMRLSYVYCSPISPAKSN